MRCIVVILAAVACVRAAAGAATSCAPSDAYFARYNVSTDESSEPGPVCGGHCCGRGRETQLKSALWRTAERTVAYSTKHAAEVLSYTRHTLQEHLVKLSHESQNKTEMLFAQIYRAHAARTHAPLGALYDDIRAVLRPSEHENDDISSHVPRDLLASAKKFFWNIFPMAYQNVLQLEAKQFKPEYEVCLKDAYEAVQPFGDMPQQLGTNLARSLEEAHVFLEMLAVGASALTTTEHVLSAANEECTKKLLRVAGCPKCNGLAARPCKNYCLNVARGCIGAPLSELDAPWAGYVEGMERLKRVDADVALRELENKIIKAIMYALENKAVLENKFRQECGPPMTVDVPDMVQTHGTIRREDLRAPPPDTELLQFAATLASTKKLFAGLADRVCNDPDFADEGNDKCWNGENIGEYTKALVKSASLSDQRYNPEITGSAPQDPRVASLADKLQRARQLLISHSTTSDMKAEVLMQGDEAGEQGSGSGRSYPDDDASYDSEGSGDEGSGAQDVESRMAAGDVTTFSATPNTSSADTLRPLSILAVATIFSTFRCFT